jgi:diguanylate cyclase (GGDEF)-like protein/PAS domain S-box-containing protein
MVSGASRARSDVGKRVSGMVPLTGLLVSVVLILGCAFGLRILREDTLAQSRDHLNRLALALAEQTERAFQEVDFTIRETRNAIESFGDLKAREPEVLHRLLHSKIFGLPQGQALLLFDAAGSMIAHSRVFPTPTINVADRNYFKIQQTMLADLLFISGPVRNRVNGQWMISLSRHFPAAADRIQGVIMAAIDIGYFSRLYESLQFQAGTSVILQNLDGTVLAQYPPTETPTREPSPLGVLGGSATPPETVEVQGVPMMAAVRVVQSLPLAVVLMLPQAQALESWSRQSLVIGGTIGLVVVVILALVLVLTIRVREQESQGRELMGLRERLDSLLRASPSVIYASSLSEGYPTTYCSPAISELGYLPADIVNRPAWWVETVHPDDRATLETLIGRGIEAGRCEMACRLKLADQSYRWFIHKVVLIRDAEGRAAELVGSFTDITPIKVAQESLRRTQTKLTAVLDAIPDLMFLLDSNGRISEYHLPDPNHPLRPKGTALGRYPEDVLVAEVARPIQEVSESIRYLGTSGSRDIRIEGGGGGRSYEVRAVSLAAGSVLVMIRDMTDIRRSEARLRLAARVFESSHDGILIADPRRRILSVNQAFISTTGYLREEIIGRRSGILVDGRHPFGELRGLWQTLHGTGLWKGELWARRSSGDAFPVWASITVVPDESGGIGNYIAIFSDLTETKSAAARIEYLSHYDQLTGLPNKKLLTDFFETARADLDRPASRIALICCDLDNFKAINETLGHSVGDVLLGEVAERIQVVLRKGEMVSRTGGDEFLILLTGVTSREAVLGFIKLLRARLAAPFLLDQRRIAVTVSLGIALYPEDGEGLEILLQKADTALFHAKSNGRNTEQWFSAGMTDAVIRRLTLQNDLRLALERDEFVLHYQPFVDLQRGAIVGAEALIRWQSAEAGLVPPGEFIPVAEDSGLIVPIGHWVLRQVCRQSRLWREAGLPELTIALNISAIQLRAAGFVESVHQALHESGLPPEALEIELTESALISEDDRTLEVVARLEHLGVRLSIDDFGTGWSSLAYLKRLRVDKLKIDRSFVADIGRGADGDAIVIAVLQMAQALRLESVAEGVETAEQLAFLRGHGCDTGQGFLFSRPLPADRFAALLAEGIASDEPLVLAEAG